MTPYGESKVARRARPARAGRRRLQPDLPAQRDRLRRLAAAARSTWSSTTSPATPHAPARCCSRATARRGARSSTSRTSRARSSPSLEAPARARPHEAFNVGRTDGELPDPRRRRRSSATSCPAVDVAFADGAGPDIAQLPRRLRQDRRRRCRRSSRSGPSAQGVEELYEAYRRRARRCEDFLGPRFMRIEHVKELQAAGRLDDESALAADAGLAVAQHRAPARRPHG